MTVKASPSFSLVCALVAAAAAAVAHSTAMLAICVIENLRLKRRENKYSANSENLKKRRRTFLYCCCFDESREQSVPYAAASFLPSSLIVFACHQSCVEFVRFAISQFVC